MKKTAFAPIFIALALISSCNENKKSPIPEGSELAQTVQADTAFYGVGGSGTSMHSLMVISDTGDTLIFAVTPHGEMPDEGEPDPIGHADEPTMIAGGIPNVGDRVSVTATGSRDELTALAIVNLTSLQGRWNSIERDFEICEGGVVKQASHTERAPWTEWRMYNGQLILGTDTFAVNAITPDSLLLENSHGIYAYTRKKAR